MFYTNIYIIIMLIFCSDKRDEKRNGTSSKSSRKKSPEKEKERSKSTEKSVKTESSEYDPGTVDKVSIFISLE